MSTRVFELEGALSFDSSGFYKAVKEAVEAGEKLKKELESNDKAMEAMEKAVSDTDKALQAVEDATKDFTKEAKDSASATSDLDKKMDDLGDTYKESEKRVSELEKELEKVRKESGENADETKKLAEKYEQAQKESEDLRKQVKELEDKYKTAQTETKELDSKTSKLGDTMETAGEKFKKFADFMKNGLVTSLKVGAGAIAAAGASVVAIVKKVGDTAEYGDNIDKMSQKLGMTAEAYQEWDFIMQHCGSTIEAMQGGMKTLATAAETGSDAFEQLGLSQYEIANMSQEELFGATIEALQNVKDESERTYLASKLLGRGGTELGALLNTSAEDVEAMREQVHALGGVMSNEAVQNAAKFQDSLQDMKTSFSGLTRGIFADLMPSLSTAMQGVTAIFSGDGENGLAQLSSGISDFVNNISTTLPKVIETGGSIVSSLVQGVSEKLPELLSTMTGALSTTITQLLASITNGKTIKQITTSAKTLFSGLITGAKDVIIGIAKALPSLLLTIGNVLKGEDGLIKTIGAALKEAVPAVLDSLENVSEVILDVLPDIIRDLGDTITDLLPDIFPKVLETLWNIIDMIANSDLFAAVADIIPPLFDALITAAEKSYPKVFEIIPKVIEDLFNTISTYFEENESTITEQVENLFLHLVDFAKGYIPELLRTTFDIILAIAGGILDSVPNIYAPFEKAFEDLGSWLFDVAQKVKDWITEKFEKVQQYFEDLGGKLYDWRQERITALGEFLSSIIQKVIDFKYKAGEKVGDIISFITGKITGFVSSATNWGKDLISNFVGGISDKWNTLKDSIGGLAQLVDDYIGFSEPEKGALSNFHTFAPDMIDLFAKGIRDNADEVYKEVKAITDGINEGFNANVDVEGSNGSIAAQSGTVNIYNTINLDGVKIASDVDIEEMSDKAIQMISEKLEQLRIFDTRAYGGVVMP